MMPADTPAVARAADRPALNPFRDFPYRVTPFPFLTLVQDAGLIPTSAVAPQPAPASDRRVE